MQNTKLEDILDELQNSATDSTQFSEHWSQGRSAFGGLSASFAVTAMRKKLTEQKPIRSLMVSFIAPIPAGEVSVEASLLRQGRSVSQCEAKVIVEDNIALQAMAVFGTPRDAFNPPRVKRQDLPEREHGIAFSERAARLPDFLQFFDGYWIGGGLPYSGNYQPFLTMWVRHKQDLSRYPAEKVVAIADIPPPVLLSHFDKPYVPASSLSWSLDFVEPPESIEGEWFFLEFEVDAAADGYTQQSGRIYDESGRLVALTRQCMVYFG